MDAQLRKGTIELSILLLLKKEDYYGYQLGKILNDELKIKEGTVYLILQRLEKSGEVSSYMKSVNGSKKRKYYKLTTQGNEKRRSLTEEWLLISDFLKKCINEESDD